MPRAGGADIANTVRMMRTQHRGAFAVVEGTSDLRVYGGIFDTERCRIVPAHSKAAALEAIQILEEDGAEAGQGPTWRGR